MTRIVFLTALTALVGCKKDECDDTAAGACDTGAEEVEEEEEEEEVTPDSCHIAGGIICIEANEADNEAWCNGLPADYSAEYSADACPDGATNTCTDLDAGGDYTAAGANAYYYDGTDGESACTDGGGTYN